MMMFINYGRMEEGYWHLLMETSRRKKNEESVKLLKKIVEMEIEEFPSHITEKIKNIWETWNSPPRLSSDSLHLDEIEEMNLNNMLEG
ncbi:hypothetical protein Gotur_002112 [Gossypium turneri]